MTMLRAERLLKQDELRELELRPARVRRRVNEITERRWGKSLFRTRTEDQIRLLKLIVWQERYKVSMEYILSILVPVFLDRLPARYRQKKSLGVRISTLTGRAAERILKDAIKRQYRSEENIGQWAFDRKEEILEARWEDGEHVLPHPPSILAYASPAKYMAAYRKRIRQREEWLTHQDAQQINRRRKYRMNPWL